MKFIGTLILLACIGEIFTIDFFSKNCCQARDHMVLGRICDDGKRAPWTSCCGKGSCNVMCCNCDGGCKTGNYELRGKPVFSYEITPNLGFSGDSQLRAGAKLAQEAAKAIAIDASKVAMQAIKTATSKK